MTDLLPWVLSVNTLTLQWLVGDRKIVGWVLGVVGQAGWLIWIILSETWGFAPMWAGLTVVYVRNWRKWRRENQNARSNTAPVRGTDAG